MTITWIPPVITGQSHVFYDVRCLKTCDNNDNCVDTSCGNEVSYVPSKEDLSVTQVTVTNLLPFQNYTFTIYSKNRVSEVAKRRHGLQGNFGTLSVKTNESGKLLRKFVEKRSQGTKIPYISFEVQSIQATR